MSPKLEPKAIHDLYEVHEWKHAGAILQTDFRDEWNDIAGALVRFKLRKSWITEGGGNEGGVSKWFGSELDKLGWKQKQFDTKITVDRSVMKAPTHKVDCFKNEIALEIEWNNKDPFYDRDLNNFRLLFDLRAISVGIIVTRSDELQNIFASLGQGKKYGQSTTHMGKLLPRVNGGGGGGCPILVFGITKKLYDPSS